MRVSLVPMLVLTLSLLLVRPFVAVSAPPVESPSAAASGGLAEMLGRLPSLPLGEDGAIATYASPAAQLAALGMTPPGATADEAERAAWGEAVGRLALPQQVRDVGRTPEWRDAFGFDVFQIDQSAEYLAPPLAVTAVRGRFDSDELRAAWERSGYEPLDVDAGEAYAVRGDFEVALSDPVGRLAMAYLNVVGLADDGTLIFSSAEEGVRGALAAIDGDADSLADQVDLAPIVDAAPSDLVSALLVDGSSFLAVPDAAGVALEGEDPEAFATRAAEETYEATRLPGITAGLLGQTAGTVTGENATPTAEDEFPPARAVAVVALEDPDAAETAAGVIEQRLADQALPAGAGGDRAGRPWAELFPERTVRAVPGEAVVVIELGLAEGVAPSILQTLLFQRALGFLAWSP